MKVDLLLECDLDKYREDILKCCRDNPQIFDIQCELDPENDDDIIDTIRFYINNDHCMVQAILSNDREYLFGIVFYEDIRMSNDGCAAQIHFITDKGIWGSDFHILYPPILRKNPFDIIYGIIPANCRGIIALCKKLGFKKTGYIPKSIPYKNVKGEVKMFDQLIYTYYNKGGVHA